MATYTINAKELEGVILCFRAHPNTTFPVLHHTLNSLYGVYLYETDFHFLFYDVPTNGLTKLYKDAPKRLLNHLITHIQKRSESIGTRSKTDQVEKLFKTIQLTCTTKNNKVIHFKQVKELATAISHFLKHPYPDDPKKCLEIQFIPTRIYPSPVGIVDGLNMNNFFSSEQTIPAPFVSTVTAASGTHLANISTTMLIAVTDLSSKVAANHINYANVNKDETIDYKDMPTSVCEQYDLKNHPVNIITSGNLKLYHNDLMVVKHNAKQKWCTVEYPALETGNTTKHDGQTYLIMNGGTLFGHVDHQ